MAVTLDWNLPPDEALAFFRDKGLAASFAWQDIVNAEHDLAFTVAKMLDLDLLADVRDAVDAAIAEGKTAREFADELEPELVRRGWWGRAEMPDPDTGEIREVQLGSPRRLRTIFHTNMQTAYAAGHWSRIEDHKAEAPYLMYDAVRDSRTRPQHAAWDGTVLPVDDPFWSTHYPPNGWNCFPPWMPVRCDAKVGLKTWYAGKLVQLDTAGGNWLTVTAKHPVLTGRGWLPADQVEQGDQLVAARRDDNAVLPGIVEHEQTPARAEDLFQSLAAQGLRVVPMAPDDFHGDAFLREPEIHVAGADRALVDVVQAARRQLVGEGDLQLALHRRVEAAGVAPGAALAAAVVHDAVASQDAADSRLRDAEPAGDVRLAGEAASVEREDLALDVAVAGVGGTPGGAQQGRRLAAGLHADPPLAVGLAAPAVGDAAPRQDAPQGWATDAELDRQLLEAGAGAVAADEVVLVRQFDWAGHVYDFSTTTGLILAGGLVVSNCRCSVIQLDRAQLDEAGLQVSERPGGAERRWENPRTGEVQRIPVGIDRGWAYHPGRSRAGRIREILAEKTAAAGELGAAARGAVERGTGGDGG